MVRNWRPKAVFPQLECLTRPTKVTRSTEVTRRARVPVGLSRYKSTTFRPPPGGSTQPGVFSFPTIFPPCSPE